MAVRRQGNAPPYRCIARITNPGARLAYNGQPATPNIARWTTHVVRLALMWWALVAATLVVLGVWFMTSMPGSSHSAPLFPLDDGEREICHRVRRHVEVLAGEIGERNLWRAAQLEAAAAYIARELRAYGYLVREQPHVVWDRTVKNLDCELTGRGRPDEIVVVGAHYDSVAGCPGAGDNGSGVAAMLELARMLKDRKLNRTVRFAAFVNEEPPFCFTRRMGSLVYARECWRRRERIVAMFSLETIGYYSDEQGSQRYPFPFGLLYPRRGNFIAFVANLSSRRLVRESLSLFRRHAAFPSEGVAAPGYLPGIFWSDHWSFWRQGYKAVMITDTAPFRFPYYHTPQDTPDKLDYERMAPVVGGMARVVEEFASR
jgi:hypothetical protein